MIDKKFVYFFGEGKAEGSAEMKNLLGGKGANLAEMTNMGIPVPPGFTITTEACTYYYQQNKTYPEGMKGEVQRSLSKVEEIMEAGFDDAENPLLFSVRSGARQSMPGMMDTVLNVGLTTNTIPGVIKNTKDERFVYDAYRRLIMMYADVVMEKAEGIEPEEGKEIRKLLENAMSKMKEERGVKVDTELSANDLKILAEQFKEIVLRELGKPFPDDAYDQLWGGIGAVFQSWDGKRAKDYRKIENIPDDWGTAVNVQTMVFGNMGDDSATGVAFTRNPATGEDAFYGEWLPNAQGEDVVAGTRTPNPINEHGKTADTAELHSLEEVMPNLYKQLDEIQQQLEYHYHDMQDIEFTIQKGKLWMLQTRIGKRNGPAAVRMAVDMLSQGLINKETALIRVKPSQLDELLHPMVDPASEIQAENDKMLLAKGLPAGPGGATGQIVFSADDAKEWAEKGKKVILVRNETSPEDVHGMHVAAAVLTAKGGMTSHAALVARGWGKCCIVGCSDLDIDMDKKIMQVNDHTLSEGDWITLNGTKGRVYEGTLDLKEPDLEHDEYYNKLMKLADEVRKLGIRTNADRPEDAQKARDFGAEGIGLCRTEHMFFNPERIKAMREMIVADNENDRRKAVMKLLPYQRDDFQKLLEVMQGLPVTIRLLDPPLHEFVHLNEEQAAELAKDLNISLDDLQSKIAGLMELNPMLGHRGCRLGITYPEITEMQARAIFEATANLVEKGLEVMPEVMIPLVGDVAEFDHQADIVHKIAAKVMKEKDVTFKYLIGTMIELPRACLTADKIAENAQFFSFGTNDLTQTTFGFSRDDIGSFLPDYIEKKIIVVDPFQSIDQKGVGLLVKMGVGKGRNTNSHLKIGVCGEHGGDPASIDFFHRAGLNYVSCSPFRVPIARLAAAHAAINNK